MIFYVLCVAGWIVLWFRPDWRWLAALGAAIAAIGPVLAIVHMNELGIPLANLLRNAAVTFITGFATFAVPGALIILLRRTLARSNRTDPTPPS